MEGWELDVDALPSLELERGRPWTRRRKKTPAGQSRAPAEASGPLC